MKGKPPIPCTDPAFKYTPASHTDIRKTFARIRRQLKEQPEAQVIDLPRIKRS